ncbi:MAG: RNA polymerase sigma factor, partial [Gammaproteobacteria bacterium]
MSVAGMAAQHTVAASDIELVRAARARDDGAFEELYRRYHRPIAGFVRGFVRDNGRAEDVAQEAFVAALKRIRATECDIQFKPWIYEIAKNACIDNFRRVSRADEVSFDADDNLINMDAVRLGVEGGSTPDAALDAKQQLDHLCGAFGGLSETHHR